jgi:hypothetical protein
MTVENKDSKELISISKQNREKEKEEEFNQNHSFINPGQMNALYSYNGVDLHNIDREDRIPGNYHG